VSSVLEPTAREDRIGMLDTTRGIAVLGILLMNITGFGLPYAYDDPTNWGGHTGADLAVWRINALFFEGTMRGLFTLLFGAGALLFLQRHTARSRDLWPADLYFRRTLWLIALGLLNGYLLLWDGDILFFYGVVGLLLFVFRNIAPRRLIVLAAIVMSLQTLVTVVEWRGYHEEQTAAQAAQARKATGAAITAEEQEAIETFAGTTSEFKPARQDIEATIEKMRHSYASAFDIVSKKTWYVETAFFFRHGLLESLGMMLLGMALLKLGILSGTASTRTYLALAMVGYTIGLTVNLYEVRLLEGSNFGLDALVRSYLTYDLGRIPMTFGHLGLIGLMCRTAQLAAVSRTLAAVGQMALTNYLAQSVICMLLFTGAGLALYGQLQRHELYYIVGAIWLVQLVGSSLWLRQLRFGPAEWLWRSLTYWRRQPMRRTRRSDSPQPDLPLKEIP
jgi:uncharacterized protein